MFRRKRALVRRVRPPRQSAQQEERLRTYRPIRDQYLRDNPDCVIRRPGCLGVATDVHHGRGKIGDLLFDTRYFVPGCRPCHRWAETHPKEAKAAGFSDNRHK